jgi:hypothetical protein
MKYKEFIIKHYQMILLIVVIILVSLIFAYRFINQSVYQNEVEEASINEDNNHQNNDNIENQPANEHDNTQINSTSVNDNKVIENKPKISQTSGDSNSSSTDSNNPDSNSNSNSINSNANVSSSNNSTTANSSSSNSSTTPKELTEHEKNMNKITTIYQTYGYKIAYGEGTYCYAGDYCEAATDETKVGNLLDEIKKASANFPSGFFRKFQNVNGYRVYIYGSIPGGTSGVASYEFGNDNVLELNANSFDISVYYHETFHLMERYIDNVGGNFSSAIWASFNPPNYVYGNAIPFYWQDFNPNDNFLYEYGETNEREDRATLFADLMIRAGVCKYGSYKDYMASGTPTNLKFKYLVSMVNKYFPNDNAKWNYCVK